MWHQTLKQINYSMTPQKAASLWNADKNSLTLVNDGINLVYRFEIAGKGHYLRITHSTLRSPLELRSAINYQNHLSVQGAPICEPLISTLGHYIEEVSQDNLVFLVHATKEVPGKPIHFDYNDKQVYFTWGKSLAKLHQAAKSYQPDEQYQFLSWENLWQEVYDYVQSEEQAVKNEYQLLDTWFSNLEKMPSIFGLTHGDHWIQNVLYDGEQVYLIDFDEPVYHWFLADIARPFAILCDKPFTEWKEKFEWYIEGYKTLLPLESLHIQNIPWFIRMKNLEIYLWTKNNWHSPISPSGGTTQERLKILREIVIDPQFATEFALQYK